ncbi:hypothetical protein V5N11_009791 [Cardamine amara subsp. amara]|uniref:SWIM-type domain-containing protein n=1 Tax=Cardamine amara subsp. amara TaxID=228776 RepID=A0ABD0ZBU3_CARAN
MNFKFKKARTCSLLPMIDAIIEKFSERFNKHRRDSGEALGTSNVVDIVENILHTRCAEALLLSVTELNSYHLEYSVIGKDGKTYLVDLKMKSCSCRCFDIDKYPCVHAIAAARYVTKKGGRTTNISIYDLCSKLPIRVSGVFLLKLKESLPYRRTTSKQREEIKKIGFHPLENLTEREQRTSMWLT